MHAVTGLAVNRTDPSQSPCRSGVSRWVAKAPGQACDPARVVDPDAASETYATIVTGLKLKQTGAGGMNPIVRDISILAATPASKCDAAAAAPGAQVEVDGTCWGHAHKDELSVYDFTLWVNATATAAATNPVANLSDYNW